MFSWHFLISYIICLLPLNTRIFSKNLNLHQHCEWHPILLLQFLCFSFVFMVFRFGLSNSCNSSVPVVCCCKLPQKSPLGLILTGNLCSTNWSILSQLFQENVSYSSYFSIFHFTCVLFSY